ncbi:RNA polymerase sigma factor [Planctomicrobium sp. SH661]|uniref:RNA polymerase sigma factor n=1 Tax=Planctomicrobium sp. SH661 TaxID=3448124 RepID=UPI003F5C09D7
MADETQGEPHFESLLVNARAGSEEAIAHLVNSFSPSVYRSIRRSLARSLRRTTDSDDIAQSVWKSFFAMRDKHLCMESPEQLRGFLAQMAAHKTIDRGRRFFAQQRRGEKAAANAAGENLPHFPADRKTPSPSEELIAREVLEKIAGSVPEKFAAVIKKRAEGATINEISEELGIPLRSLHRILQNARARSSG